MAQTAEEYYDYGTPEEGENWGGYQYVTLKHIVDELLVESTDPDSFLNNTSRTKIIICAKNGVRVLNREIKKSVRAMEMTVGTGLYVPLPQDYVDWLRVSFLTPDMRLQPLDVNRRINTAIGYLQDQNAEVLFDSDGYVLTSDSSNAYGHPYSRHAFTGDYCSNGYSYLDTSKLSKWGECKIDERRGTIVFSSNLEEKEIVLEYISDGLDSENLKDEEITINKVLKDALIAYTYMCIISKRRHVPFNEKLRAKREYKSLRHKALIDAADFDINEIAKLKATKQI